MRLLEWPRTTKAWTGRNTMQVCKENEAARCINTWKEDEGLKHLSSIKTGWEHISPHNARAHETVASRQVTD
jgi:hypothetical protein